MKKIEAIIRPLKLDDVRNALADIDVTGMTIYHAKGTGRQEGYTEIYRGAEYDVDFLNKIKLEILVEDDKLEACLSVITEAGRTGKIGDGKIYVSDINQVIRIRTGETGEDAM